MHELAYIDADGALMLYDADSGEKRKLTDINCGRFPRLTWSPDGETLACAEPGEGEVILVNGETGAIRGELTTLGQGQLFWAPRGDVFAYIRSGIVTACGATCTGLADSVAFYDTAGERTTFLEAQYLTAAGPAAWSTWGWPLWSPDGTKIVYKTAWRANTDGSNSELAYKAVVFDLATGVETMQQGDVPLAWAFDGDGIITAGNHRRESPDVLPSYQVSVIRDFLELRSLSQLDNSVQFWVAPGGEKVVYLIPGFAPVEGGSVPGLGVLDLLSGESTPIEGSLITYGSDHIPQDWVTFSEDGKYVYWVGGDNAGYRAEMDGSELKKVLELEGEYAFSWSPDHEMIFYNDFIDNGANSIGVTLYAAKGDGTDRRPIDSNDISGSGSTKPFVAAWRPAVPATSDEEPTIAP